MNGTSTDPGLAAGLDGSQPDPRDEIDGGVLRRGHRPAARREVSQDTPDLLQDGYEVPEGYETPRESRGGPKTP